jgi:hypothetical protein
MAKEYSFRTKSYAEDLIPEAVLDSSDPVYQFTQPTNDNQSFSNIDLDVTEYHTNF